MSRMLPSSFGQEVAELHAVVVVDGNGLFNTCELTGEAVTQDGIR